MINTQPAREEATNPAENGAETAKQLRASFELSFGGQRRRARSLRACANMQVPRNVLSDGRDLWACS